MGEERAVVRLAMRALAYDDVALYRRLTGDSRVMRWITAESHTEGQTRAEVARLVERFAGDPVYGIWVFTRLNGAEPVGVGGLIPTSDGRVEIGYRVLDHLWGQGFGTAIARQLVENASPLEPPCFVARVTEGNVGSQRILERLGFRPHTRAPNDLGSHDIVYVRDPMG